MKRYIDANRLWLEMASETAGYCFPCDMVCKAIENTETVDVVPVIRCKECRFNYGIAAGKKFNPDDIVCTYFETDGMNENDYCSKGERKEE